MLSEDGKMSKYCDILENTEEGFVDLTFDIRKVKKRLLGGLHLECAASYCGADIGFGLDIKPNMQGLRDNDPHTFCTYRDGLSFSYLHGLSEALIPLMLKLYGFEPVNLQMKKSIPVECGALSSDPLSFDKEVRLKCFVEPANEKKYAEFYINVDVKRKKVYMREKDPAYRGNIILYLGEPKR